MLSSSVSTWRIWPDVTQVFGVCYLERFIIVEFLNEVEERMRLPEKKHVASQAVSFHWDREQTAAVIREGERMKTADFLKNVLLLFVLLFFPL